MRWFGDVLNAGPKRDGFLGIGGSSSKTDRTNQLNATTGAFNVFNSGLSNESAAQTAGTGDLSAATNYWRSLLSPGRTVATQNAAPAIDATVAQADATRNQGGQFGTGRTGGTAAANQGAATNTQSTIDQIINQNLTGGKATAAQELQSAGSTELSNAVANLGISGSSADAIMSNASNSYQFNTQQQEKLGASVGSAAADILLAFL